MCVTVPSVASAGWNEAWSSPCGCLQFVLYNHLEGNLRRKKKMLFPHWVRRRHLTWFIGDGTLQLCIIPDIIKAHLSQPDTCWAEVLLQFVCVDFTWSAYFRFIQLTAHWFIQKIHPKTTWSAFVILQMWPQKTHTFCSGAFMFGKNARWCRDSTVVVFIF